jgi:GTP-binding protein
MQISALSYDSYVGVIGVGRIVRGRLRPNQQVIVHSANGKERKGKVLNVKGYLGLDRIDVAEAKAGDIVCINGIDGLCISDTLCDPDHVEALPALTVDEPTVSMTFSVNDSPFAGKAEPLISLRYLVVVSCIFQY